MAEMLLAFFLSLQPAYADPPFHLATLAPSARAVALDPRRPADFARLLDEAATSLVGKPYELGPLGEGAGAEHPEPLYRLDAFDCTTFVETVLANAHCAEAGARAPACLASTMQKIRYGGNVVSYRERNHVPELDWLPHNVRRGYLEDLREKIFPGEWRLAEPTINRELWIAPKTKSPAPPARPRAEVGKLAYLPVALFFEKVEPPPPVSPLEKTAPEDPREAAREKFRADLAYLRAAYRPLPEQLAKIPSGTVLSLVRAAVSDAAQAKLTPVVSHQGLVLQRRDGTHFLHAAPNNGHVSDQLLGDYLLRYVRSAHVRGISLYRALPER